LKRQTDNKNLETMKSRNGKVARLPEAVREELNQRLERCQPSPQLLPWLNALPEVQEFVQREFGGEPVSKQNLSQWRLGGFQDWLSRRDFLADARHANRFAAKRKEGREQVAADQAATVLAARYAGLMVRWNGKCTKEIEARARVLNGICRSITDLQREARKANRDNFPLENQGPSQSVAASHSDLVAAVSGLLHGNSWHKPPDRE
jgi:hypothetical protein